MKADEYRVLAESGQLSDTQLPADRGVIYDSNMEVLAESASAWLVYVNPSKIKDDAQRKLISETLAKVHSFHIHSKHFLDFFHRIMLKNANQIYSVEKTQ